mmetsp:Transcript_100442/g.156894  ORF Transcript_100442/g.156894 Transcript_100442/m.156894 type:complete len:320 (-) Transcript_100442:147-1106(-)
MMAMTIACLFAVFAFKTSYASNLGGGSEDAQEVCYADECRLKAGQSLLQVRRSSAIFEVEKVRTNFSGPGDTASLDEAGYNFVKALCCSTEMAIYIERLIESKGMVVCHKGGLHGLVLYYDCTDDTNGFAELLVAIGEDGPAVDPKSNCPWIGNPVCPPRKQTCGSFPTATFPPCLDTSTSTSTTLPPVTSTTEITTQRPVTSTTEITTQRLVTTTSEITSQPPPTQPPTPPPYKCSSFTGWGAGECTNKPSRDCVFVKPEGFNAGVGDAPWAWAECGKACAERKGGCCYWKPKEGRCKWCPGARGDNAGAGGRYQCIV